MNPLHIIFGISSSHHSSSALNNGSTLGQWCCIKDARSCCLSFSCSLPRSRSLDVSVISGRQKVRASAPQQDLSVFWLCSCLEFPLLTFIQACSNFLQGLRKNHGENYLWNTLSHEIIDESLSEILREELVRLKTPGMDPSWSCLKGHFTLKWIIYSPV